MSWVQWPKVPQQIWHNNSGVNNLIQTLVSILHSLLDTLAFNLSNYRYHDKFYSLYLSKISVFVSRFPAEWFDIMNCKYHHALLTFHRILLNMFHKSQISQIVFWWLLCQILTTDYSSIIVHFWHEVTTNLTLNYAGVILLLSYYQMTMITRYHCLKEVNTSCSLTTMYMFMY